MSTDQTEAGAVSPADHKQRGIDRAAELAFLTVTLAGGAQNALQSGDVARANAMLTDAINKGMDTMNALTARTVGAVNPIVKMAKERGQKVKRKESDPYSLASLETLDTPDARELLDLLEKAQAVAERVDRSRGKALPEGTQLLPGESLGIDLAESLSLLALRLRTDINGPAKGHE